MPEIYLDYNATTPLDPRVAQAMWECERAFPANPSSQHSAGRRARQALDDASEAIGALLGLRLSGQSPDRLVYTSGGTEANNLALLGLCGSQKDRLITTAVEHSSVIEPAKQLMSRNQAVEFLPVDHDGLVDLDWLSLQLENETRLVSIQLANQETGVLQPVAAAAAICATQGVPLHTDAVQAIGKIPVNFAELGVAALTVAAHKFHGPRGIGLLAIASGVEPAPLLFGGFQQQGLRPSTEPLSLIVGMRVALELWQAEQDQRRRAMSALRDELQTALCGFPGAVVHGGKVARLPQTLNVSFPGIDRQTLLMALDLAGIACSAGSACASGSSEPSTVLKAMGCNEGQLESALRFSLGSTTTSAEVQQAADRILNICNDLRQRRNAGKNPQASRHEGGNSL